MNTTLLVESNTQLGDFYSLNLHTWVGCDVKSFPDAKFAIEYLQQNPDIKLIISRAKINSEKTAEALADYISSMTTPPKLIVLGQSSLDKKQVTHLPTGLDAKLLVQATAKNIGVTAQDMANKVVPEYFPIPSKLLLVINKSISNIYKQKEDSENYDLFFEKDKVFSSTGVKDLKEGHFDTLYLQRDERLKFVNTYNREVAASLEHNTLNEDEQIKASELTNELLQQRIAALGINSETIKLAQKNLIDMGKTAKKTPSLMNLLKRLMSNKTGYLFKHSQILMFLATHLMEQLDWGTPEQSDKLRFIAFFHDIALEDDIQAQIHSEEDLKNAQLPAEKKELVKAHAQLAAVLISKYPNAPIGAETILKQHHGTVNGLGFSDHFSQNISPMAIVFILSEDFVDELITAGKDFDIKRKIAQMREKHSTQRFQKIINVLESIAL